MFVADANSTDGTPEIARSYADRFDIEVIPGGLPAVGRNAGAARAQSRFLLFVDADVVLKDRRLLSRAVAAMKRRRLQCLTTNIWCSSRNPVDRLIYAGNNLIQYFATWTKPFATGMFMMFERQRFGQLGGFNERALYAEDYLLSKQVPVMRFGIVTGGVLTSNRRFQKMGRFRIIFMFFRTAFNTWNEKYFLRDHKYWEEPEEAQQSA